MGERIALGTHVCVDWECIWDVEVFCTLARSYDIKKEDLRQFERIYSEKEMLISIIDLMCQGAGGEIFPGNTEIVEGFASKFQFKTTLGGTATRAAILLAKLGKSSVLQMCTDNSTIRELLPKEIRAICENENCANRIYPHASITYPKNAHIVVNDIDFMTSRENRVLFSMDPDSDQMYIDEKFGKYLTDAKVFLLGSFGEVLDEEILKDRVAKTAKFLADMPKDGIVLFEDGGYHTPEKRTYVHEQLREYLDIVSMNEDELQQYIGRRINLQDPDEVLAAVQYVHESINVPTIFVHSSLWAIAYGENASRYRKVLEGGIASAGSRFWFGDDVDPERYERTKQLDPQENGRIFAEAVEKLTDKICCVPCKDLSFVELPTVVGLGDTFAGGLVMELAEL